MATITVTEGNQDNACEGPRTCGTVIQSPEPCRDGSCNATCFKMYAIPGIRCEVRGLCSES
ncbi:hypothetical protein U1Q18_025562, partial [Sarracenia purpurea var. burkii]